MCSSAGGVFTGKGFPSCIGWMTEILKDNSKQSSDHSHTVYKDSNVKGIFAVVPEREVLGYNKTQQSREVTVTTAGSEMC